MTKRKRKLTLVEKEHNRLMREKYEWVFLNGKQKRIRRVPQIEEIPNDPIWLLQNEMYEELHKWELRRDALEGGVSPATIPDSDENLRF